MKIFVCTKQVPGISEVKIDPKTNTLIRKGLVEAIEEFLTIINKSQQTKIDFTHTEIPKLAAENAIHLFRIFQEIVHNTIKHAGASELKIELKKDNQLLVMNTIDNGIGFDHTRESKEQTGLGLRNLLTRTEVLGGTMYVESGNGKGTKFTFEFPV